MCFGKKSSNAQPAPAPAAAAPPPNPNNVADNSNDPQLKAQRLAATDTMLTGGSPSFGSELGTSTLNQPNLQGA